MTQGTDPAAPALSIGDLADETGVSVATLRVWEQRHGFPPAERLPSGHRRYRSADVDLVRRVVALRGSGLRLDEAIGRARASEEQLPTSIFAAVRAVNPMLPVHRLTKTTLLAMSWAIEDEFMARAVRPRLYGTFQDARHFVGSRARWRDLAQRASSTTAFADFPRSDPPPAPGETGRLRRVALAPDSPLHQEWVVVCDSTDLPVVLACWEIPGQQDVDDRSREFEAVWSLRASDVAVAARVCARAAGEEESPTSGNLAQQAGRVTGSWSVEVEAAAALFARAVAYLDRQGR